MDDLSQREILAWQNRLHSLRLENTGWQQRLAALNPYAVLQRGYAIVSTCGGQVIHSRAQVTPQAELRIQVSDGAFKARVTETNSGGEK
jgi:exodeoxyribonuclease VII large subunit